MMRSSRSSARAALRAWHSVVIASALMVGASRALADRYEATVAIRPIGIIGRFTESVASDGQDTAVSTYGGGGAVSVAYGARNWLDVGVELLAAAFLRATYNPAQVTVMGVPTAGRVTRTTRLAQLRVGGTARLGVAWVPTLYVGLGPSMRMPTAGTLRQDVRGDTLNVTPDGMAADTQLDACVVLRVGIDHRLNRRWSIGLAAETNRTLGLGSSPLDLLSVGMSLSYTWYPNLR